MSPRAEKLHSILTQARNGQFPLIFVIPGSGQVARCAVAGGAHFLMVLNAGLYRMSGVSSLASFMPYGNANTQTENLIRTQILPRVKDTPVVAGVMGNDPTLPLETIFSRFKTLGVAGATNWPAVGLLDGEYRKALAEETFTFENEVETLKRAKKEGFVTFGFVFSPQQAAMMTEADVDALVLNLGWTHETMDIYEKSDRLQYAVAKINKMIEAVDSTDADPVFLYYGGAVTLPEDSAELYRRTKVHGFGGGSSFERIPIARLITNTVKQFSSIPRKSDNRSSGGRLGELVGASPVMLKLYRLIEKVAPYDVSVCIEGESGVGKELVATYLHLLSQRSAQPFITQNCGAIQDTLMESEFFGHEKGAFTGAVGRRLGKFELADHGTLFLDEVAELSNKAQVSLLRAIQQKEIFRVGGEKAISIDVRIITATHQDLNKMVAARQFRADLYFRLNMITLKIPPLRARTHDIPVLVDNLLRELALHYGRTILGVTRDFMKRLMQHSWPGNVRELKHVLGRAILLEDGPILAGEDFGPDLVDHSPAQMPLSITHTEPFEKEAEYFSLKNALQAAGGNKSKAARMLGITRKTLYTRMRKSNLM